jgi:N-carbamoyl-L-amino-acid hydrolase
MFTSEEPTRFGMGCVGSRGLCGALSPERLADLRDKDDQRLDDIRRAAGFTADLSSVRMPANYYAAFAELHIEQGPLLERENIPIGVVTAIAAPAAMRVTVDGEGGHAGAVLMPARKDALCAAAEIILAVEAAAKGSGSPDAVATTGVCCVHPGAINSVPSQVKLEIDIRDVRLEPRDKAVSTVRAAIDDVASHRGVKAAVDLLNADPPATMAEAVVSAAAEACKSLGLPHKRMVSRAYHDSLYMSRICDTGMIFIPCRNGVSHRPDEYAAPEAIANGVGVLALTLAQLSEA